MASRVLPLLTLLCVFGGVYCQASNQTMCGDVLCPQSDRPVDPEGNRRDECCNNFVTGCCSSAENTYLRLIRDVVIGVSVGVVGLILILSLICCCCCCCICCD